MWKYASAAAAAILMLQALPAGAQTAGTTTGNTAVARVTVVEPAAVMKGYRASKIVGSTVTNEANETVGKIDDLVIRSDDRVVVAILSVGGFLGVGDRLVAVPYDQISWHDNVGVLPGVTKDRLKTFPQFSYAK